VAQQDHIFVNIWAGKLKHRIYLLFIEFSNTAVDGLKNADHGCLNLFDYRLRNTGNSYGFLMLVGHDN